MHRAIHRASLIAALLSGCVAGFGCQRNAASLDHEPSARQPASAATARAPTTQPSELAQHSTAGNADASAVPATTASAPCGPHGDLLARSTLSLTMIDATTQRPICDGTFEASDANGKPLPLQRGLRRTCSVVSFDGRPGVVTVRASHPVYGKLERKVEMRFENCRWFAPPVVFEMKKNAP